MQQKDYLEWHNEKSKINNEKERPFFHEGEIWFASLGSNIGFEQDGRGSEFLRPVLVLKKFNNDICLIVPLSKTHKKGIYYYSFSYKHKILSTAILSQIRLVDVKRLQYKSGDITELDFRRLKQKLKQLIA
jgi:mRNA-degrading endonuclease toxin of MazEF toxin-antitoxin module